MSTTTAKPKAKAKKGDVEEGLGFFRQILTIRGVEETIQSLFQKGEVHGTTHLYVGQEAVATGVSAALGEKDRVASTYRGHGHAIAIGVDPQALLAEMLGREGGVCGGRSGSMNVIDLKHRLLGSYGIIGGSIAAATGAGLGLKRQGGVAVAYFGDGTMNQGYIHECLNFSKKLELPVVYVCENNLYGEFTPMEDSTAGNIEDRPKAFGVPTETVDGMDVWAVREAAEKAVKNARDGGGPSFIQAMTYRFVGHSRSDPGAYRKEGELDEWKKRDPIIVTRDRLHEWGASEDDTTAVEKEVADEIVRITDNALASPYPTPSGTAREFKD